MQIFVLSVILQLLVIAAPFYMQITIDEVIARGDVDLLVVLALGFRAPDAIVRVATSALRSLILLIVQNVVQFQLGARLFRHLIRLPIVLLREAAHRRHPVPLHLPAADPQPPRRRHDRGGDRWHHGGR